MKKIIFIFFIACSFLKCTCSSDNRNKDNVIKTGEILTVRFDVDTEPVNIHETGLIYDVKILNLDCEEAIFSDRLDKIIRHRNRIYLLDTRQTYSVFIYDTLGNFVSQIDGFGQGPNEYIQLSDIFINHEDETLNLVSRSDSKLLKYDLDGKIIRVEKTPKWFTRLLKTEDGYLGDVENDYFQNEDRPYNLWTLSNSLELKNGFFEMDPTWFSKQTGSRSWFSRYNGIIHYTAVMDFNIYSLKDGIFSTAYHLDFGKRAWPEEYREYKKYEDLLNGDGRKLYILNIDHFQETRNHLIAEVIYRYQPRMCIYNKNTGKTYVAMEENCEDEYFIPFGNIISTDENAIYALIDASQMKFYWEGRNEYVDLEARYPEQVKRLREKFPHFDEEGNPFLVIYYIR
jgi:hypothetical protein